MVDINIKVTAHHRREPHERFIEAHDYDESIPNWRKVDFHDVHESRVITCSRCDMSAVILDAHWPWMSDGCRCEEHSDFRRFPLDDA